MLFTIHNIIKVSKSLIFITFFFSEIFYLTGFLYSPHNECCNSLVVSYFPSSFFIQMYFYFGNYIHSLTYITLKFPFMIFVLYPQKFKFRYKSAHQTFHLGIQWTPKIFISWTEYILFPLEYEFINIISLLQSSQIYVWSVE